MTPMPKLIHIWIRLCNWVRHAQSHLFRSHWMVPQWSLLRISNSQMIKSRKQLMVLRFQTRNCQPWMRLPSYNSRIKHQRYPRNLPRMWWQRRIQYLRIKQSQLMALRIVSFISRKPRSLRSSNRDQNQRRLMRLHRQNLQLHPWRCNKPKRPWLRSHPRWQQPKSLCFLLVPPLR